MDETYHLSPQKCHTGKVEREGTVSRGRDQLARCSAVHGPRRDVYSAKHCRNSSWTLSLLAHSFVMRVIEVVIDVCSVSIVTEAPLT